MKPIIRISSLLFASVLIAACGPEQAQEPADTGNAVATVNGKPITEAQFAVYERRRGAQAGHEELLDDLISIELLAQAAERQGLDRDADILGEIASHRAATLAQAVVRAQLDSNPITDEQVEHEYQRFLTEDLGEELHARHILVTDEDEARALIARLDEGADFAELAREHSQDGSAAVGGDLGWFEQDMMVEPFGATAAALETGHYTPEPVQTRFGWHIILLDGRRGATAPPLDEIRDEIIGFLQAQMIEAWVNELRGEATIERY